MSCIVTITNTDELARSLDRYLQCFLATGIESYYMTYRNSALSGPMVRNADLFILELLRRDDIGYRAEAIPVAEKFSAAAKRVLIVSGAAQATVVNSPAYWDLAALDPLHQRVRGLLGQPPLSPLDMAHMREVFREYCRPAVDHHAQAPQHTSSG